MSVPFFLQVVLLAVLQGITEFLPVSSSGHLVLAQKLLGFAAPPLAYDVCFHLGTLLAVVVYFFRDLRELALRFTRRENFRLLVLLAVATLPAAAVGLLFRERIESLFSGASFLGWAFWFTAAVLLASRFLRRQRRLPDVAAALLIGAAQAVAILPGVSRSGMTIAVALLLGLSFDFSFRFSFLLSIPAVLGAVVLEAGDIPWRSGQAPLLALGVAVAAATGLLALAWLRRLALRDHFHRFAWYLVPLGAVAFLLL